MNPGLFYALGAYVLWGLFPLYLRQVAAVPAFEVVLHRSLWSLVVVLVLLAVLRRWRWLREAVGSPRRLALFALSALLLSANWLVYVWAVQNHRVVDASLGYFINPLVSVLLGTMVLRERLRRGQWLAVALAAAGVLWLTVAAGQLPWIALLLAGSFGLYGLMRKTAPLGALEGLALETMLLAPLAFALLAFGAWNGSGALAGGDRGLIAWLVLGGPFTAVPLLLFAAGARRLPLATMGLLQYVAPSLTLALGLWVFDEPFDLTRLVGFALIWLGLAVYSAEGLAAMRKRQAAPGEPAAA